MSAGDLACGPYACAAIASAAEPFSTPSSPLFCSQIPFPLSGEVSFSTLELLTVGARQFFVVGGGYPVFCASQSFLAVCLGSLSTKSQMHALRPQLRQPKLYSDIAKWLPTLPTCPFTGTQSSELKPGLPPDHTCCSHSSDGPVCTSRADYNNAEGKGCLGPGPIPTSP